MAGLTVKVGIEIDSSKLKTQLDQQIKELAEKKIKLKLDVDMSSIKELQKTFSTLAKDMAKLKLPTVSSKGSTGIIKEELQVLNQQGNALKEQKALYSDLSKLQNEEFSIKKKMISASDEEKAVLQKHLDIVTDKSKGIEDQIRSMTNLNSINRQSLQIDEQREKKQRELEQAQTKYNASMQKLKDDALKNMNTEGLSTKEIDEYRSKLQSIDTVTMDQVKGEIADIGKEMDKQRKSTEELGKSIEDAGKTMSSAGDLMLKAFSLPTAGLAAGVKVFGDFSYEMDKVGAVSQSSAEDLERLTDLAKQMGLETMYSAKQSAEALTYMGMAG